MNLDEWFDTVFCRPCAAPVARALATHTRVTPDQVTAGVALFGLLLIPLFGAGGFYAVAGAALFLWLMVQDCVDGQLARLRGGGSWRGRVVDGLADMVCAISAHVGLLIFTATHHVTVLGHTFGWVDTFFLLGATGASMTWNARVLDGLKQNLKPDTMDADCEIYREHVKTLFDRFVYWFWTGYATAIARYKGANPEHTHAILRRVQWSGPTHHHLGMVIAGAVMPWVPAAPIVYALLSIFAGNALVVSALRFTRVQHVHGTPETVDS